MKKIYNNNNFWLFIIIVIGLLLRLYKINSPILDLYPTRQEQCAMIARNFFRHSYNIFHAEVDWFGPFDSSWRLEFPLISYMTALLYSIFGIHEFLGRLVSIAFSLGSIYLIFQLTEKLFNQKTAIYASFLFTVSPLGVYFGRTFMPDTAMIFFSIWALFGFLAHLSGGNWAIGRVMKIISVIFIPVLTVGINRFAVIFYNHAFHTVRKIHYIILYVLYATATALGTLLISDLYGF